MSQTNSLQNGSFMTAKSILMLPLPYSKSKMCYCSGLSSVSWDIFQAVLCLLIWSRVYYYTNIDKKDDNVKQYAICLLMDFAWGGRLWVLLYCKYMKSRYICFIFVLIYNLCIFFDLNFIILLIDKNGIEPLMNKFE